MSGLAVKISTSLFPRGGVCSLPLSPGHSAFPSVPNRVLASSCKNLFLILHPNLPSPVVVSLQRSANRRLIDAMSFMKMGFFLHTTRKKKQPNLLLVSAPQPSFIPFSTSSRTRLLFLSSSARLSRPFKPFPLSSQLYLSRYALTNSSTTFTFYARSLID